MCGGHVDDIDTLEQLVGRLEGAGWVHKGEKDAATLGRVR